MFTDFLINRFKVAEGQPAVIWKGIEYTYGWLLEAVKDARGTLLKNDVHPCEVVSLHSDFNPYSIAYLIALIENANIVVPISCVAKNQDEMLEIAHVKHKIAVKGSDQTFERTDVQTEHDLLLELKVRGHPGLVLFSSGSTGKSKASVHDFVPLLEKFKTVRTCLRTITFLLFDHIGGINTLFYILSHTGTAVTPEEMGPEGICKLIEQYKVELLPTSPTFLNMILMSGVYERYDLSSLKIITYGTEVMPESTLKRLHKIFDEVKLKQTYGLSEIGVMRSKSRDTDSLWVKVGGEGYQTKIVDGILFIKAKSAMLGYLNAPTPFDEDGWFNTQDRVEVDGEWIRILGRDTDIINVGGQKVYPAEVESVLLGMENVSEVSVSGKSNPIMGNVVAAKFSLVEPESLGLLKKHVRNYCKDKLESFKVPVYVEIAEQSQVSQRFKKIR